MNVIKVMLGIVLVVIVLAYPFLLRASVEDGVIINVIKTERVTTKDGDQLNSKYLVFTTNEVFENTDSWVFGKFNSSDLYGKLTPGRYKVKVCGWRLPYLSSYRNIPKVNKL